MSRFLFLAAILFLSIFFLLLCLVVLLLFIRYLAFVFSRLVAAVFFWRRLVIILSVIAYLASLNLLLIGLEILNFVCRRRCIFGELKIEISLALVCIHLLI